MAISQTSSKHGRIVGIFDTEDLIGRIRLSEHALHRITRSEHHLILNHAHHLILQGTLLTSLEGGGPMGGQMQLFAIGDIPQFERIDLLPFSDAIEDSIVHRYSSETHIRAYSTRSNMRWEDPVFVRPTHY